MKTQFANLLRSTALGAALIASPFAAAQTPPNRSDTSQIPPASVSAPAKPAAPVYTPTSLVAEPGLPRTPDGHPDFQNVDQ